ncbi:MbtH family NRPS accessory protein [Micromonospora sp. NPDC023956]|uniref:MbtH family protein n=1 Tax=Micromonospora sp. NPDC023956 TaxID=3155722 RepID=UPI0033FB9823
MSTASDHEVADDQFVVVRNHEEQYSIWHADSPVPVGWDVVGEPQSRQACLDRIDTLWVDMRPASLRRFMTEEG